MRLTLTSQALLAADTATRVLRGTAIPYGVWGNTSAGRVCVDAGAVRIPEDLRTVKTFIDHGRATPTGYTIEASDTPDRLEVAYQVGRTQDGDRALLEAAEGIRDSLSVELDNVTIEGGHVVGADLVALAQVPLPAFAGAQLVASLTPDQPGAVLTAALDDQTQAQVADLAQQITDLTAEDPTSDGTPPGSEAAMTQTTDTNPAAAEASRPSTMAMLPPANGPSRDANTSLELFAAEAAARLRGVSNIPAVAAALNDIVPANTEDPGGAFMRPAWLGELWAPLAEARPLSSMVGVGNLTSPTFNGWKWTTKPVVASYAGNKTPVPSSPAAATVVESGPPDRVAGAWDIDRIYVDFNTGMISSFYEKAVESYAEVSEAALAQVLLTAAGAPLPASDFLSALAAVIGALSGEGARLDYLAMATDVFVPFSQLTSADVPWWLQAQGSVNLTGPASTTVAGITVGVVPSLPDGALIGGDRRALDYRESGPIRVEAVNIPQGGVDLGLFGYANHLVIEDAGLAVAQVTVTPLEGGASRTAKKSS